MKKAIIPTKYKNNCKTCNAEYKDFVYELYVNKGWSGKKIHRELLSKGFEISISAVEKHTSKHIGSRKALAYGKPVDEAELRQMIKRGELGETTKEELLTSVISVAMQKVEESTVAQGIAASKLLHDIETKKRDNLWSDMAARVSKVPAMKLTRVTETIEPQKVIEVTP